MAIAVVGWGSLFWNPDGLDIEPTWYQDGPMLPVEFARFSSRDRLTLVLVEGVPAQPTLWAVSRKETLEEAAEDLQVREGTGSQGIGRWSTMGGPHRVSRYGNTIAAWAVAKELDGAVWTALGPTDLEKKRGFVSDDVRIEYLRDLERAGRERAAREYIEKAPPQIETPFRALVRRKLVWGRNL